MTDNNGIKEETIEINPQFKRALDLLEKTDKHVFITGRAGTGKSTLLNYFRNSTKKEIIVLAPTGVAAVNINGMTIHSFFHFKPDITPQKIKRVWGMMNQLYKAIDMIVIDEISMVRADLLDCADKFLRLNGKDSHKPFGGIQMVFVGDLYQLPPVVKGKEKQVFQTEYKSQYFFDSHAFEDFSMEFVELEKIYRQKDDKFIQLLNAIRNKSATENDVREINKRLNPHFEPPENEFYITLTTTNKLSDEINTKELGKISSELYTFRGTTKGEFDRSYFPTSEELHIKIGSQVMLLNNDRAHRWVNGSVGKIINIAQDEQEKDRIIVELSDGSIVKVGRHKWDVFKMFYDKDKGGLNSESIGSFIQFPLRLAWAVTIHKGQGKTFDNVIIDIGQGTFTHGQIYVALSRCTTLQGIVLKKPIRKEHIFMDWKIVNFLTRHQYNIAEERCPLKEKIGIIEDAIKSQSKLAIVYLKSSDVKSSRIIEPTSVGEMSYQGKTYIGVKGYCFKRQADRVFRVDRILDLKAIKDESFKSE